MALAGCQAFLGAPSFADARPAEATASVDMSDYFAARIESGRMHLAQGRPTQAVTAFRQASYNPAYAGRAYNGMAVAYAQLGREDLARRYFTMAVAADPQDERFARNLARLEQAPPSVADIVELASTGQSTAQATQLAARPSERQAAENSGLRRISSREVEIRSTATLRSDRTISTDLQQSARLESPPAVVATRAEPAPRYPVRIELPQADPPARTGYPVRIALSDVRVTRRSTYPVRIELPDPQ